MKINDIINQFGEPTYFTPFEVWAEIYQPDAGDAMANSPFEEHNKRMIERLFTL